MECSLECVCTWKQNDSKRIDLCAHCKAMYLETRTKLCSVCRIAKDWECYNKDQREGRLFGLTCYCKECQSRADSKKLHDRERFLRLMLKSCKDRTKLRNTRNSERNLKFNCTYEEMCSQLAKQEDKCAYSGLPMSFRPHTDWKCSPERINNNIGYIASNIVFICLEFQLGHKLQSSPELVDFPCKVETQSHFRLNEIMSGEFIERQPHVAHCQLGKHHCKECQIKWNMYYNNTLMGRLSGLAEATKRHTKSRN